MRVLIYGEGDEALALLNKEREAGHRASIRNPEPDLFDADRPERADVVHAWSSHIWHAYEGKSEIHYHGHLITEDEAAAYDAEEPAAETAPKPKRKKAK